VDSVTLFQGHISLFLVATFQSKILNYDIYRQDKIVGTAKILIKITQDGGKRTDTKLTLTENKSSLEMHTTQVWGQSGRPTLKIVLMLDSKGVETSRMRVDFRASDLLISQTVGGKLTKSNIPIPPKAEIRDLPEFWFLRDVPVKGKAYKYWTFNTTSLQWEETTSTFIGPSQLATKERTIKQNQVTQQIGKRKIDMMLDEAGFPVNSVTSDGIRIVAKS
ncbi:MAG: hypothetical protein WCG75_10475, partial [Armatimonadota bacterium]